MLAAAIVCTVLAACMFLIWIGFLDTRHPVLTNYLWYILFCALAGVAWSVALT